MQLVHYLRIVLSYKLCLCISILYFEITPYFLMLVSWFIYLFIFSKLTLVERLLCKQQVKRARLFNMLTQTVFCLYMNYSNHLLSAHTKFCPFFFKVFRYSQLKHLLLTCTFFIIIIISQVTGLDVRKTATVSFKTKERGIYIDN